MTLPVVVIGAGPVGLTAALLLARWGIEVRVIDGKAQRDLAGSKSIVQQRDVIDVWDAVGAGWPIANSGVTWRTARTYYKERELFAVRYQALGSADLRATLSAALR